MIVFLSYVVTVLTAEVIAWNGAGRLLLMICDVRILKWSWSIQGFWAFTCRER